MLHERVNFQSFPVVGMWSADVNVTVAAVARFQHEVVVGDGGNEWRNRTVVTRSFEFLYDDVDASEAIGEKGDVKDRQDDLNQCPRNAAHMNEAVDRLFRTIVANWFQIVAALTSQTFSRFCC